jgi:hypothetical protein
LHNGSVRSSLQRAQVILRSWGAPADKQDRCSFKIGIGDGSDTVGDAGSRSGDGYPDVAGKNGMGVSHMDCRAFVTYINYANSLLRQMIPDRLYMCALQAEYAIHLMGDEKIGYAFCDRMAD